jgi:hypothetical protein
MWLRSDGKSEEIVNANFYNGGIGNEQIELVRRSVLKDVSLKGQK